MNAASMSSDPSPAEGAVATGRISADDPARRLRMRKPAVCPMCEVPVIAPLDTTCNVCTPPLAKAVAAQRVPAKPPEAIVSSTSRSCQEIR